MATTARFLAAFPPRSASLRPQRLRSESACAGAEHVLGALHEQMPEQSIAGFCDVELRLQSPGLILARTKTKVGAHGPGAGETIRIFYGEHEGERC